jgi:hypothetical protein
MQYGQQQILLHNRPKQQLNAPNRLRRAHVERMQVSLIINSIILLLLVVVDFAQNIIIILLNRFGRVLFSHW